ncbi:ABC transporter permease [Tenacibaculum sp. 190524A05c]|uniref:ABC transporter permease n=1 Tax=Tenacibaculum platacis TaxID=3137852 RepID=UPI0032B150C6
MNIFPLIKYSYLQRVRNYNFLITLCASLAVAYTFVPAPDANYSTIRIADYVGDYNSAWFGYVTAIMSSLFLSLVGFYLINGGIKTDVQTKVGQIIATTKVTNATYLFSKVISGFLILLTILGIVLIMSIALFHLYNENFPFEIFQFIKPYFLITIPALFLIAVLAVVFEVFFRKYTILQNIGFFFLFSFLMLSSRTHEDNFSSDMLGTQIVMNKMENQVRELTQGDRIKELSIGYVIGNKNAAKKFHFNGMEFPYSFIISRIFWIALGALLVFLTTGFFHRFSLKESSTQKAPKVAIQTEITNKEIQISGLSKLTTNFSILPLLRTELLLLIRKGKKWLWFINGIGMLLLALVPLEIAHQFVLPILWFFQVSRISGLTTKEFTNKVHYFAFASFKPLQRLLISQLLASILLLLFLALPLLVRLILAANFIALSAVILGGIFIVFLAAVFGIVTKGKKLFEVVFFMITYTNINKIPFTDYFGALSQNSFLPVKLSICILMLGAIVYSIRNYQLKTS